MVNRVRGIIQNRFYVPLKCRTFLYTLLTAVILISYWVLSFGIQSLQGVKVEIPELENSTSHERRTGEILEELASIIPGCILNNVSYGSLCIFPFSWHPCGNSCSVFEQVCISILSIFTCVVSIFNLFCWIITKAYKSFVRICIFILICSIACLALSLTLSDMLHPKYFFANGRDDLNILQVSILYKSRAIIYNMLLSMVVLFNLPILDLCLLNIILVIIFPTRLMIGICKKTKITIVTVEICICLVFSIIVPILTLLQQPQLVYFSYKRQLVSIDPAENQLLSLVFNVSLAFFGGLGFTMGIIILLLVHYRTLKFRGGSGTRICLTNLEKRLICFTIVIFPLSIVNWSILAWSAFVHDPWLKRVIENILCTQIPRNFTNTTLIDDQYCSGITSYEEYIPSFLFIVQNVLSRIALLPELLLTFPDGTTVILRKYGRKLFR